MAVWGKRGDHHERQEELEIEMWGGLVNVIKVQYTHA